MREKDSGSKSRNFNIYKNMLELKRTGALMGFLIVIMTTSPVLGTQQTTTGSPVKVTTTPEMETCQCGVFLLGLQPLIFSAEAKPILSGMPVPANCSAREDKLQCATICRQLIETMSQSHENSPLVQTVVLAATRTLACQRFNESERVPLPRTLDTSTRHHARLDDETNKWKFLVGPLARSDVGGESDHNQHETDNGEDLDGSSLGKLTKPKYLGGFYRWCDEHWIYAGISLHEPLCCIQHLPKKCPTTRSARNERWPRLIIRRCKNDDCSSEEDFQNIDISAETPSTSKTPPTTQTLSDSEETESPDNFDNSTSSELEQINPFDDTTTRPVKNRKPLNSTVVAEAFKFVNSLMDSLGYGDVVQGITSVLPQSTASELLERVDVGGWVSNYQDRYMTWPREFSMGYCYVEYSLYNMASDGFMATTNNLLSRVFKAQSPSSAPSRSNMPSPQFQGQQPPPLGEGINGSPLPVYGNNPNNVPNYISPMPPLPENSFNAYGQPVMGMSGNRRVRRGVTVSRSYSATGPSSDVSGPPGTGGRRAVRRKLVPRARNAPQNLPSPTPSDIPAPVPLTPIVPTSLPVSTTTTQYTVPHRFISGNASQSSFVPSTSFIPTNAHPGQSRSTYFAEQHQPIPLNPEYRQFYQYGHQGQQQPQQYQPPQYQQAPAQRSQPQNPPSPPSLVEYARPRRNPPLPRQYAQSPSNPKQGPQSGNLMNIANMLVQTALAGNGQSDGDKVTSIMQNALPLVSQVATNPAIQSMVSSLVTSFLTPPQANKPRPPPPASNPPSQNIDEEEEQQWDSQEDVPTKNKSPPRKPDPLESNEINEPEVTSSNNRPNNNSPPSNGGGGGGGGGGDNILTSMVSQMISTYIKHLFSPGQSHVNREPSSDKNKPPTRPSRPGDDSSKPEKGESKDIVDMICGVAEPFFLSYFGIVPGEPGFGKLRISDRRDRLRFVNTNKDGNGGQYNTEILQNDPDPGTGLSEIIFGSVNLPETGSGVYDFGNRVVYAFSRANDPQQGMYCFKQYVVNKLWDYFRVGVRAVFKK